jgi:hypothetical protein
MKTKMPLLWAILVAIVSFACGDRVTDPFDDYWDYDSYYDYGNYYYDNYNGIGSYGVIINAEFMKVSQINSQYLEQNINEYRAYDTMAIRCKINYSSPEYQFKLPIVARIMSHKTGDVQYISFVYGLVQDWPWLPKRTYMHIAYISPVKYESYETGQLIPDPTKKQLKIDPKGDMLIAQIKYKYQIITIIIPVKGD